MSNPTHKSALQTLSRRQFWEHHLEQYMQSGLSRRAYCREHGLVYHQMLYWEKQATPLAPATVSPSKLIPVELSAQEVSTPLTVVLPNGIQIRDIQPGNLGSLNRLLEQLQ